MSEGLPPYRPPTDEDAPLDAVEQAVVAMWISVLLPRCREALADAPVGHDAPSPIVEPQR